MSVRETIQQVIQKEIAALETVADSLDDLSPIIDVILQCTGKLVITGMGKSGLIGRKISATFSSTATPSSFVHPAEALHGDIGTIGNDDLMLLISNSGETEEMLSLIPFLKRRNVSMISMICKVDSTLAQKSDFVIPILVNQEADPFSLIPTSSTTAMLAVGDALAVAVLKERGLTREQFAELHPSGSIGRKLLLQVEDIMHQGDDVPVVKSSTLLREVVCLMGEKRLGSAFVVSTEENTQLVGVFTDGDLRRQLQQRSNPLDLVIDEVMTPEPITVNCQNLAMEAVAIMQARKITILPVLDGEKLVGAIHLHDLIKAGLG
ncbi:MAG: KpsF/GutQ family sugar-phosphate isomerase [Planctomycetota bacterium]|nr:KpsF/GutQ family sugar-phosphate isomerase [Planctomycetota bacterium]